MVDSHAEVPASVADRADLHRSNLSVIMRHLRHQGPQSRTQLAGDLGLPKATISGLVAELLGKGLLSEGGEVRGSIGRPAQLIYIDGGAAVAVGIEINVEFISMVAVGLDAETVAERRHGIDLSALSAQQVLSRCEALLDVFITEVSRPILGVGVAVPGLADKVTATVVNAPNLGWHDVDVRSHILGSVMNGRLEAAQVLVDNEANLSAVAEYDHRVAAAPGTMVFVNGFTGVGGGILIDGKLIRGAHGFAGEFGHMPVVADGETCGCGRRGCWETVVGMRAFVEAATEPADPLRDSSRDVGERARELGERLAREEPRATAALEELASWLARGLGVLVNVCDPDLVVLGGYFAELGDPLITRVRRLLPGHAIGAVAARPAVVFAEAGMDLAPRGAALAVLSSALSDPMVISPTTVMPQVKPRRVSPAGAR